MTPFPEKCDLCTEQQFSGSAGMTRDPILGVISHELNVRIAGEKLSMCLEKCAKVCWLLQLTTKLSFSLQAVELDNVPKIT